MDASINHDHDPRRTDFHRYAGTDSFNVEETKAGTSKVGSEWEMSSHELNSAMLYVHPPLAIAGYVTFSFS